jgi:putative transposase
MTKELQSVPLGLLDEHLDHCVGDAVAGGGVAHAKPKEALGLPSPVRHPGCGTSSETPTRGASDEHQHRHRRRHDPFVQALCVHGLHGSMAWVGACADNAMESLFALLQKNVLDRRRWQTRQQPRLAIITWTENTYHRRRRHMTLGRPTPIEFEVLIQADDAA